MYFLTFQEILKSLELNCALQHLPRLWSDMIIFDQTYRDNLLALVLHITATYYPEVQDGEVSESSKLATQFVSISWKIWSIIENQDAERNRTVNWTGKMLGDLMTVQLKSRSNQNAWEVMKKLMQSPQDILGIPTLESLKMFLDAAIDANNGAMALVSFCLALA